MASSALGVYASEPVAQQLRDAYAADTKLDMGKSCVRFRRLDELVPEESPRRSAR